MLCIDTEQAERRAKVMMAPMQIRSAGNRRMQPRRYKKAVFPLHRVAALSFLTRQKGKRRNAV